MLCVKVVISMKIPFSNRTVGVELPNTQGQAKVTVKNIMEDFHRQTGDNFPKLFEAFVLLSPRKVRITCRTAFFFFFVIIIIIIIKNFVCSPKGFSAYNYNMQFKIKLYYIYYSKSKLRLSIKTFIYMILRM